MRRVSFLHLHLHLHLVTILGRHHNFQLGFIVLFGLLLPALTQAQTPPVPGAAAGTVGPGRSAVGAAPVDPRGLYQSYDPQALPPGTISPNAFQNPIYGGTVFNYTPPTTPITSYLAACFQGASLAAGLGTALGLRNLMDNMNEKEGFKPYKGIDRETARKAAPSIIASINAKPEAGCQKFINKDGEIGPWGRTMLTAFENHKDVFEKHTPDDVKKYCPTFPTMNGDRRKLFWLWFFASVAQPESSCRSHETSQGPNGTAIGLFQMDPPACSRAGVPLSATELLEPANNIRCAVAVFANEMHRRNTIMVGTSQGSGGTYWGTLRNDDNNTARGGDIRAAQQTRSLLTQYPDCKKEEN